MVEEPQLVRQLGVDLVVLRDLGDRPSELRRRGIGTVFLDEDLTRLVVDERDADVIASPLDEPPETVRLKGGPIVVDPLHGHDSDRDGHETLP